MRVVCVWTYQCLASISGKLDEVRRENTKMAGNELRQATNIVRKNGCLGDVLRQDH